MRRLRDDARALHDEGLEHPIAVDDVGDEVGEVARALEDMRRRLLREETDRQEFLSVASHELRTPLATLQGSLELLSEDLADGTEARRRADGALRQTHRLVTLASDLLDLSRIDGGVHPLLQATELVELPGGSATMSPSSWMPTPRSTRWPTAPPSCGSWASSSTTRASTAAGRSPSRCGARATARSSPSRTRATGCPTPAASGSSTAGSAAPTRRAAPGRVSGSPSRAGWPRRWTASCARPADRAWSCACGAWTDYPAAAGAGTPTRLADGRGTNVAARTASSPTTTEATKAAV